MAVVTVWTFDAPGFPVDLPGFRRAATQAAIERFGYARRPDESLSVDERLLDGNGLTREEYLTFRVKVLHSEAFAGYSLDSQRLQVMGGEYEARLTIRTFNKLIGAVPCVRVIEGDSRGGDLWIKIEEFDELANFPDVENPRHLEVHGWRVTDPEEL